MKRLILFDGICRLCNGWVAFLTGRDSDKKFEYASLQSPTGQQVLNSVNLPSAELKTMIYVRGNDIFVRSTAVLEIFRDMKMPWPLFYGLIVLPVAMRDAVYNVIARNRYRWFGQL